MPFAMEEEAWNGDIPVGGRTLSTNMKMAFSALSLILFRITYTNCPTVRSAGTRYLQLPYPSQRKYQQYF